MEGVVYGAAMEDETKKNPQRVKIRCEEIMKKGIPKVKVFPNVLRNECKKLLLL